jgi:amidohydrolase
MQYTSMEEIEQLKNDIALTIEQEKEALKALCLKIHDCPETGLEEHNASAWITQYLEERGFSITKGIGTLSTAFLASYGTGKPHIAILAEYDALPELGHACGHNIIGTAAAGAAVAARQSIDKYGGTVTVVGSPSEEFHCGKELLIREGVFSDIDLAMMIHPGSQNVTAISTLACINLEVEFRGQEAHASANPEEGVNALEAMILGFNAINSLRQHIPDSARIHGIITDGGQAANIVPAYSAAMFMVRATSVHYLETLKKRVEDCFKGAATATGAKLTCHWASVYCQPMKNSTVLAKLFNSNMALTGRIMETQVADFASTDMGNVSQLVPAIHPIISIAPSGTSLHSTGFLTAAASDNGIKGMLDGAQAMALTISDILADKTLMHDISKEFQDRQ